MATENFSRFCNQCYAHFTDPVKYEQHIAVCGKPATEATEPVKTSDADVESNVNANTKDKQEPGDAVVPEGTKVPPDGQTEGAMGQEGVLDVGTNMNADANVGTDNGQKVEGATVPEDVPKSTDTNETPPEPQPAMANVSAPPTEATEPVKTSSRSKTKTK